MHMVGFTMEIYYDVRSYKRQIGLHCFERKFALHNIIRCVFVLIYNIMISNHLKKKHWNLNDKICFLWLIFC